MKEKLTCYSCLKLAITDSFLDDTANVNFQHPFNFTGNNYLRQANWQVKNLHLLCGDICSVFLPCAKYQVDEIVPTAGGISLKT